MSLDDRLRTELRSVAPASLDEDDALRRVRSTHRSRRRRVNTLRVSTVLAIVIAVVAAATLPRGGSPAKQSAASVPSDRLVKLPRDATLARADVPRASATGVDAASAVAGDNAFGFDLYRQISSGTGNIVFSPQSLATALAMTVLGAHGRTQSQMLQMLHATDATQLSQQLNALDQRLLAPRHAAAGNSRDVFGGKPGSPAQLTIDDSMWAQKGFPLYKTFLDAIAQYFGAGVNLVDFRANPDAARLAINRYVNIKTQGLILNLLPPGIVDKYTVFALINTLTFNGAWQFPFDKVPGTAPFHLLDGTTVQVPTMRAETGDVRGDGYQAVRLPYVGGATMNVIVPDAGNFGSVERNFGPTLAHVRAAKRPGTTILVLPKFSFASALDLNDPLKALGMRDAFVDMGADLSNMTPRQNVYISHVVQNARIEVDEHGTRAAAASAVLGEADSLPPTLQVDRPFLFAITDDATGAVLFTRARHRPERALSPTRRLPDARQPAVDREQLAGHVARVVAQQEHDRRRDLPRRALTPERHWRTAPARPTRGGATPERRVDQPGRDHVRRERLGARPRTRRGGTDPRARPWSCRRPGCAFPGVVPRSTRSARSIRLRS